MCSMDQRMRMKLIAHEAELAQSMRIPQLQVVHNFPRETSRQAKRLRGAGACMCWNIRFSIDYSITHMPYATSGALKERPSRRLAS